MASANNPLFPLLISLLFFSFLCLCGDDLSSSSSLANDYPLSVEEIQLIIESHVQGNDLKRELITNEVLNMLFKTEEELTEDMSHYAEMDETDKKEILYLFFNRILPTILKYDSSRVKNGEKLIQGTDLLIEYYDEDSDTQYKEQTLKQKIENLLAGNNADRCVSCRTLKNLAIMMCAQNFPILPGRCVECSFLRNLTNVMCNLTCNVLPNTNIPCVTCGVWYQSIYMLCGAPNCSCGNYYGLEKSQSESLFKRSNEFDSFNALSCVPCYNMWLGYQFLCNDLYSYCPATPTPTPSPSPPPNPSNYNYYQYNLQDEFTPPLHVKQPSKQANSIQQQYKSSTHDPSSFSNLTCTGTPLDCKTLPGCNAIFNECCYELSQSEQPYCCCFDPIVFDWEPVDGFYFPRCNLQYPYELGGGVCCDTVSPDVFAECIYVGNTVTLTPEPSLSPSKSSGFVSKSSKVSSLPSMTPTASPLFSYNPCPNGYTLDTTYFACCRDYYQFVPCDVQAQYYGDYCIQITKSTETQFTYLSDNPVQATFKGSCPKGTYTLENFSGCCKQGSIYDSLTDSCIYNLNCKNNNITLLLIPGVLSVATRTVSPTPSVPLSNSPSPSRLQYTICEAGRYTNAENYFQCCPVGYYFDLCRKICSSETGSLTQKTSYATALYGCPGGTNRPQALNYCCPTGTTLVSVEGFYFCRFFDVVCNFQEILLNPVLLEGGRYTATLAPTPNYSFEHCKPGSSMDRDWFVCCPDGYSFDHCSFGRDFCTESNGYLVNVLPMEEAYYYNECPQGTYLTADKNYCCKNGCTYNNEPSFPACICKINCTIGTNTFEDITVPLAINLIVRQSVTVSITPTVSALPSASKYIQNCPAGYGLNDTWYQCCPTGSQFDMCENTECISPTQRSFPLAMIYEGTSCPVGTLISLVGTKAFCCPYNSTLDYSTSVSTCIVDPDWYNENCGFYDEPKINVITLTNYQASATRSPIVTTTRTQTPSISASPLPKVNCREGFVLDPVWDLCCEIGFTYDPCLEYCVSDYFNKYSTIVSISLPEHAYFFQCPPGSQSYPVQDRCCGLFGTLVAFDVCEIDYQCSGKYGPVRYPSVIILSTTSVTPTKSPSASISYSPKCPANTYYSEKAQGCCPLGTVYDAYFGCCYNKINGDCPNVIPITNPTTSVSTSLSKSPSITRSNSRTPKASLTSFTTTPSLSSTISLSISVSMTPLPTPLCQKPNTNSLKSIVQQLSLSSSSLSSPLEFFNNGSFSLSVFSSDKHFLINEGISQQELEALGGFFLLNYGNWCGPGHGGFQDCCDGERCPACNENGILTPECILECPPVDALDNICVYHDSCTIQNPDDNPYGNTCGVVYPENYCACDCFFIQQLIQGIEFDICVTASSPLYCNTYMNAALYLFKNGYVKCYYYFEGYRDEPVCQPTDANGCYDPCEPNGSWSPDG